MEDIQVRNNSNLPHRVGNITCIKIFAKAEGLPNADWFGKSDPYYTINTPTAKTLNDLLRKTKAIGNNVLSIYENAKDITDYVNDATEIISNIAEGGIEVLGAGVDAISLSPVIPLKILGWGFQQAKKTHDTPKGYTQISESAVIKNNLNPYWPDRTVGFWELCGGDIARPILIQVWDYDTFKSSDYLGQCLITASHILKAHDRWVKIPLTNLKGNKPRGYFYIYALLSNSMGMEDDVISFERQPPEYEFPKGNKHFWRNENPHQQTQNLAFKNHSTPIPDKK